MRGTLVLLRAGWWGCRLLLRKCSRALRYSPEAGDGRRFSERWCGLGLRSVRQERVGGSGGGIEADGAGGQRIDADLRWQQGDAGGAVREALWVLGVRGVQRLLADDAHLLDPTEEDVGGGEKRESRVVVLVVVPPKERLEPAAGVQLASEPPRVVGLVLQGLELRLAERVVVRHVRAAEAALDTEGGEQLCQGVALHRRASVRVHRQARLHAVSRDGFSEELRGQVLAFLCGHHRPHHVAAEKDDDHVAV